MPAIVEDVETSTRRIGHELFARVREHPPHLSPTQWLDERLMDWGMRDEHLKAHLFRFIDVLPGLTSPAQVLEHLREYSGKVNDRLPILIRAALTLLPHDGVLGSWIANLTRLNTRRLARRFIAADDLPGAIDVITSLKRHHQDFTIDLLGEAVLSQAEALQYQQSYLRVIEGLTQHALSAHRLLPGAVNVSIKLSSLYSQFDPIAPEQTSAAVRERLRPILLLARQRGAFVNIDMEQYAYKDLTLRIFREVFSEPEFRAWKDIGIAMQAYLRSTADDLQMLHAWVTQRGTPITVRLVKGAYWDFETVNAAQNNWPIPVFTRKPDTDANFELLTTFLMQRHDLLRPAIASHNIRSIAHALAEARRLNLSPGHYEFQMLYGMADPIKTALVAMGQRVRVYTPMGQLLPGMAYLVRRLLENTSNESFLRAGFHEHAPEEQLLMNPITAPISRHNPTARSKNGNGHPIQFQNQPLSDFSRDASRAAMQTALDSIQPQLGQNYPLVIAGQRIPTDRSIDSVNPSHQKQVVGRSASASVDHVQTAVAAAGQAFQTWRDTTPELRAATLHRVADLLRQRRYELAAWEVLESGKQWREADADVAEAIDFCNYYAIEMLRLFRPQHHDVPGEENAYFYEPRGVTVVIAPWNFPLAILCGMTTAALAAGNTVVMKPAEQSPVIAAKLMEIFEEAGLPPGVVNFLPGIGEEIGPALVQHPDVEIIAFTGSRAVGLAINEQASRTPAGQSHVKRVITEMGGKNAIIIDDDADLDEAVLGVAHSAFGYSGQKCSACSRAIVLEGLYDTFLKRLVEVTRSLKVAPADDPSSFVGPVIDADAQKRINDYIQIGKSESTLACAVDVGPLAEEGFFVGPHVFADVPHTAAIARDEIFGPVLAVMKAKDMTQALALANSTPYALTGGLYSRSPLNIARVRREFRVGNLYINRKITGALVDRQPFGGFKLSGGGTKAGGPDYLLNFVIARTITENTLRHGFAPGSLETPAGE